MARGEYEIAEYYYDKIPEESVLYKSVARRRQEMQKKLASGEAASGGSSSSSQKRAEGIFITKQSYLLQLGRMPIHTITVLNNTSKKLNVLEVEFVYLDGSGNEVSRRLMMVSANLGPGEERQMEKIAPGMVNEKFTSVKVEVKRVLQF
jgi:hypothetical protein